jgi:VWFA-related protein
MKQPFVAAAALAGGIAALAAAPQEATQTFRSSIDLVRVDVNVLDRSGQQVTGLAAPDFAITVDGRPRRVVSADYVPASSGAAAPPPAQARHYSTNAGMAGGRLILIVIDQGSIPPGQARRALSAAAQFVSRLNPSDRVGVVTVPNMQQLDFTSQHRIVRDLLLKLDGLATSLTGPRQIGVAEAFAITRGDTHAIDTAYSRECSGPMSDFERRMCRQEISATASQIFAETRERGRNTIAALRTLATRFVETAEPKTVILISGGLIFDQDYSQISWFGQMASRGQLTVYSIYVMPPHFEASLARLPINYRDDTMVAEEGLAYVSDLGRGSVFRLITDPEPIFKRLESELSGYYLLGFEAEAADRGDGSHKIKVNVPGRADVDVRARPEFSAAPRREKSIEDVLGETLRTPLLASEIRLKATTYTMRDRDSAKLRVVVGAEIDRVSGSSGRLSLAFALVDSSGHVVTSRVEPDVSTRVNPRTGAHQYFGAVLVDRPGMHTLKIAVVDDLRRRGSVEHTFEAQVATAGPLRIGDLMLAENVANDGVGDAEPVISADYTGNVLHGVVEVAGEPDAFRNVGVVFEIAEGEDGRAISSASAAAPRTDVRPTGRTYFASLPIDVLPPGDYVARAVVMSGGRAVSRVTRGFKVARPVLSPVGAGAAARTPAMLPARPDAFDRQAVLASDVVGFFVDRLAARNARSTTDAIAHARAGRFDQLIPALAAAGNDELSTAFMTGLALYAKGDVGAAADRFRDALRIDSEFFPAAFYLGACYAAAGRNQDAANAWRTSLVTESDAPFIYPLIADALQRARDPKGAVAILEEAAGLWRDNEQLQLRLGTAYANAGRYGDAITALDTYATHHPENHEVLFTLMRAVYEIRSAGASFESPEKDRERFARYATAYGSAGGPQQLLVDRWRRFIGGK